MKAIKGRSSRERYGSNLVFILCNFNLRKEHGKGAHTKPSWDGITKITLIGPVLEN